MSKVRYAGNWRQRSRTQEEVHLGKKLRQYQQVELSTTQGIPSLLLPRTKSLLNVGGQETNLTLEASGRAGGD